MVKIMEQRKSGPCELEPVTESRDDAPEPLGWNCPYSSAHEERVSYIKIDALGLCFKSRPEERLRSPSSTFPGSALRGDSYSGMGAGTLCLGLFWRDLTAPSSKVGVRGSCLELFGTPSSSSCLLTGKIQSLSVMQMFMVH